MKYDAEVAAAIARWGPAYRVTIAPALVHAIIQQESGHGTELEHVEPDGDVSRGPMMVKGATGQALGVLDLESLKDPATGILYGVKYLAQLLARFPGDLARAISAYNTGPGHANRGANGKFPNQGYVDKVLLFYRLYGGAVAGAAAAGLAALAVVLWFVTRRRRAA